MRQFVKRSADGRVALVTTTGREPVVALGETLIETTDDPIAPNEAVAVNDGAVVRSPRAPQPTQAWELIAQEEQ
ncbi:MAG: hypothetical protein ACJA1L_001739 [Paracoccaceae bacterium]|jgi:hypothetical protein